MDDFAFKAGMIMGKLSMAVADLKKERDQKTATIRQQRELLKQCEAALEGLLNLAVQDVSDQMKANEYAQNVLAAIRKEKGD